MNLLSYFLIIGFAFFLLILIPVKIHVYYKKNNNENIIKIEVKILFITLNKIFSKPLTKFLSLMAMEKYTSPKVKDALQSEIIPKKKWKLILGRFFKWTPKLIQIFSQSLKLLKKVLKPVKCLKINIYGEVGLVDAAKTGMAVGSIWAILSFMLSQLSRWVVLKPETPKMTVIPNFGKSVFFIEYDCIFVFPLGHIIIVLMQTARFIRITNYLYKGLNIY